MGTFMTTFIALAIGLYFLRVLRRTLSSLKKGGCVSCAGCPEGGCPYREADNPKSALTKALNPGTISETKW